MSELKNIANDVKKYFDKAVEAVEKLFGADSAEATQARDHAQGMKAAADVKATPAATVEALAPATETPPAT